MGADQHHDWHGLAASALEWWRDAGVDVTVEASPRDWLAAVAAPAAVTAAPRPAAVAAEPLALPDTLDAFLAWRAGDDAPEAALHGARLIASGPADAAMMVMVDCPEADDDATLVGGEAGLLLDRMLAAVALDRARVHLASACATRPLARRTDPALAAQVQAVARHHVALAAPRRLLVMGDAASRAILGTDVREARGRSHAINHKDATVEVVATHHPRTLLRHPALKAEAWRDLRIWSGGMS